MSITCYYSSVEVAAVCLGNLSSIPSKLLLHGKVIFFYLFPLYFLIWPFSNQEFAAEYHTSGNTNFWAFLSTRDPNVLNELQMVAIFFSKLLKISLYILYDNWLIN